MGPFTESGLYLPWGPVERVRTEPLIAAATLPGWFSVYNNAGATTSWSMQPAASTVQGLQVDVGTAAGNFAQVQINDNTGAPTASGGVFRLDLMEIRLGVDGVTFSNPETAMDFRMHIWTNSSSGSGVSFGCTSEGTFFEPRPGGSAARHYFDFDVLQAGEHARPHNLELIARPDRWVVLRENGLVVAAHQFTAAQMTTLSAVSPKLAAVNRLAGTARWMRFAQFSLTFCH